jgi:hypothetical protein
MSKIACSSRQAGERFSLPSTNDIDDIMDIEFRVCRPVRPITLLSSSMAEHSAVNRRVVGSSPT